ncbi:tyrosine-type recombinase/integrase [Planctellipticum variicoloris]|uniref:tyrosine-type recombinase/integrase n=1 Tax=Planctellipticum variicoloris TaxID=3064265 RepID=UPI003013FE74|nr:tyrosine-type recombinase/integrase [Planctomycetaceae bacterium SH412]
MMTPEEMKAAARLTLRQFYDAFYDKSDLEEGSKGRAHYEILRWERLTENPPIEDIDNQTVERFRFEMLEHEYAPSTISSTWTGLRAILRLACPEQLGNPRGMGVITKCPYMKPVKEVRARPRRVPLNDIGALYLSCENATYPRPGFPPRDWWRALFVMAYFTGIRKGDLLTLKRSQIDLRESLLTFKASKTRKEDTFPLHELAVIHLERIWYPERELVFAGMHKLATRFYSHLHDLEERAGIAGKQMFGLHDIRRTAASEVQRVRPGMGSVFLQHVSTTVTGLYYLNEIEELEEAIKGMRFPEEFATGTAAVSPVPVAPKRRPLPPAADPKDWSFVAGGFRYQRGQWHRITGELLPRLLKLLVEAGEPVTMQEICEHLRKHLPAKSMKGSVRQAIHKLRKLLRECLQLPSTVDPVECVHRGEGGAWALYIPPIVSNELVSVGSEADGE